MKKTFLLLFFSLIGIYNAFAQIEKEYFTFRFEEDTLHGILNYPTGITPIGIVVFVHGSGATQAVENEWYYDIRERFVQLGYATYMYDKAGCGKSTGTFDYNQSVQNSSLEVIAAISELKEKKINGSEHIGLMGFSRAGWIIPLVIKKQKNMKFWISISGTDEKENFGYLLEQNLIIEGLPRDSVDLIVNEWHKGNQIAFSGGSYEESMSATKNLNNSTFIKRFRNYESPSKKDYLNWQKTVVDGEIDPETGLYIYVPNFRQTLNTVYTPVLAIFGEMDKHVDWTLTKELYKTTLGKNTDLTIKSFP